MDPVNHPEHYNAHPSGVECIEITRHMGFNLGNVVKYVWRADLKGNAIQDLKKAAFYLSDEIAKREGVNRGTSKPAPTLGGLLPGRPSEGYSDRQEGKRSGV
jgi:hypothetical protein